jgi:hypothetical protein
MPGVRHGAAGALEGVASAVGRWVNALRDATMRGTERAQLNAHATAMRAWYESVFTGAGLGDSSARADRLSGAKRKSHLRIPTAPPQ